MNTTGNEKTFFIDEENAGGRLDKFLATVLPGHSRSRLAQLVKDGHVLINQALVLPKQKLRVSDTVHVSLPPPRSADLTPQDIPLDIVYHDEDIVIVDKAAGLIVHPGAGHPDGTVVNGLLHRFQTLSPIGLPERPGVVHRIDRGTSGILVFARNERSHNHLARQFAAHSAHRLYRALAWDHNLPDNGTYSTLYGRQTKDRRKFTTDVLDGKSAVTHWTVSERLGPCALVEVQLETGRTHQIRVHLSEFGNPLVGDPMYGRKRRIERIPRLRQMGWEFGLERQALHAAQLGFVHPSTGQDMFFESPCPEDMQGVLKALRYVPPPPKTGS